MENPPRTVSENVDAELYDDLLSRYERVLVFAGQLQEKVRQQKLLMNESSQLANENRRLRQMAVLDQSYILLLERALESLGVMRSEMVGYQRRISS